VRPKCSRKVSFSCSAWIRPSLTLCQDAALPSSPTPVAWEVAGR
jgi:hypothetical protein